MKTKPNNVKRFINFLFLTVLVSFSGWPVLQAQEQITPFSHLGGWMASVAVPPDSGDLIYTGQGGGLVVWDISDPTQPIQAGALPLEGTDVMDLAFFGEMALLANGEGLQIVNLANPVKPSFVSKVTSDENARCVTVVKSDTKTFAVLGLSTDWPAGKISVIDISDVNNPIETDEYDLTEYAQDIQASGQQVYLADGDNGLVILEIDTTGTPVLISTYDTPGRAEKVAIRNEVAFIADGTGGLLALDVTDPSEPELLGTYETDGNFVDIQLHGEVAFLVDNGNGQLRTVNIQDPTAPTEMATTDWEWSAEAVAVSGNIACLINGSKGLLLADVTNPQNPRITRTEDLPTYPISGALSGSDLFLVDKSRFWIYNVVKPTTPVISGTCELEQITFDWGDQPQVAVAGNLAVIANSEDGMSVVDISDPANPLVLGHYTPSGSAVVTDVALQGNRAGLLTTVDGQGRLYLLDLTDPANPAELGSVDTPGDARHLSLHDTTAFVADGAAGVQVLNIANPAAPQELGKIESPAGTEAQNLDVSPNPESGAPEVFISFDDETGSWLRSYDVTQPDTPVFLNEYYAAEGPIVDFAVNSDRVHIAGSYFELNRSLTTLITSFLGWNHVNKIQILTLPNGRVFVLVYKKSYGIQIWESTRKKKLAKIKVTPPETTLTVGGKTKFKATGYDTTGNVIPTKITWSTKTGQIDSSGNYIATTAGKDTIIAAAQIAGTDSSVYGFAYVQINPVGVESKTVVVNEFGLYQNFPNPFNPATQIKYSLARSTHVTLKIYNLQGQEVRTLVNQLRPAGSQQVVWDGKDQRGEPVMSGVYFYRIRAGEFVKSRKMILLQ